MTVLSEHADLVRRLLTYTNADGPIVDLAVADAAKAIMDLAERCQTAEMKIKCCLPFPVFIDPKCFDEDDNDSQPAT